MTALKKGKEQGASEARFTCPDCSSRSMIKVENKKTGFYMLKCQGCGAEIGPLPLKGVKDLIS